MRKIVSVSSLVIGIVCFAAFMAAAAAMYYKTTGVFITAGLAALYAALSLLGALAVVLRAYVFAALFYAGCALGWTAGYSVGRLKGEFAPTAGVITTFFLIGAFALVGIALELRRQTRQRKKRARLREERWQAEQLTRQSVPEGQAAPADAPAPDQGQAPEQAAEPLEQPEAAFIPENKIKEI